ncbi:MAG: hypothetical protein HQL98_09145 [Magnetococcales bacterium]|nr:hypothetical protein [Magnetococcales bacterium]
MHNYSIMTTLFDILSTATRPVEPIGNPSPIPPTRTPSAGRIQAHGTECRVEPFVTLLGKANEQPLRSTRLSKRRASERGSEQPRNGPSNGS